MGVERVMGIEPTQRVPPLDTKQAQPVKTAPIRNLLFARPLVPNVARVSAHRLYQGNVISAMTGK
jgi:hypothetical protein